jgi:hypothetical protein
VETSPALDAALNQQQVLFFVAVEADLSAAGGPVVRVLDGAGEVTWSRGTFKGSDATFGVLDNIESISDGVGNQAPQLSMSFIPANGASAAALCNPAFQGNPIRVWLGAIDLASRLAVVDPYLMFDGEIDVPKLAVDRGSRDVNLDCVSSFEKLFQDDEGIRLNPSNHKEVWPGETGLDAITGITTQVIWGPGNKIQSAAPGSIGTPSNGTGGGLGGGLARFFGAQNF